jgi:hypothetical protein
MLKTLLKSAFARPEKAQPVPRGAFPQAAPAEPPQAHAVESPHDRMNLLVRSHAHAPVDLHSRLLHQDLRVGNESLVDFTRRCAEAAGAKIPPVKALHRELASYFLSRYFLHSLTIDGLRAECGVYNGLSALVMCRAARAANAAFDGAGLHLVDSYEGLGEATQEDRVAMSGPEGEVRWGSAGAGSLSASLDSVKRALAEFPGIEFHKGWIPAVLSGLHDARWSFVHVDVDFYVPTLACLEYFWPRMAPGGVVVCDDYGTGTTLFPGAHKAWDKYFVARNVPFVALPTGQSVAVKPA